MSDLALPVLEYVYELLVKDCSPAFFLLEKDGTLKNWGGSMETYGITSLKKGEFIEDYILFLQGFFPLDPQEKMELSCVQTESGISADVYIFPAEKGHWLLLLDATKKEARLTILQQEVNELRLFRDKQAKIFQQYLSQKNGERDVRIALHEGGERKYISVLSANICSLTSRNTLSPKEIFETSDVYIRSIIQSLLDEGGISYKIAGDTLSGVFGILPYGISPSLQSVKAAFRMMEAIRLLGKDRRAEGLETFDIRIGIASGQAAAGIIGSWDRRKTLTVIGPPADLAVSLEKQARANEILIDENTFQEIHSFQSSFSKAAIRLDSSLQAFSNVRSV
jgi:class 3 adenylate cyclase